MINREIFQKDPVLTTLVNDGVAHVSDTRTEEELQTLRFELENFVCAGEYERGLVRILETYLKNLGKPEQPAVWVSGFYGSGKTHLVKMLHCLWEDTVFEDAAAARGLVSNLPKDVKAALAELSTQGKRHGGVRALSGRLRSGSGDSIRLSLLGIVFRSVGLPEYYPTAQFIMWLKQRNLYGKVCDFLKKEGESFDEELKHFHVTPLFGRALCALDPDFAPSPKEAKAFLNNQFPKPGTDVTTEQMKQAIRDALEVEGKLPLTLIALDEVQQYIGDSRLRCDNVAEVTEICSKEFGGKVLFVATGQSALIETPLLQWLRDRFSVHVQLSDTDVEQVLREVVLKKKPDKVPIVQQVVTTCSGEICRHLTGTRIQPVTEDEQFYVSDYPLLPVRRRFWERAFRAVDTAGKHGQLRTQLKVVHEATRTIADKPVGHVVPADFMYNQQATDLLQTGVLLREIHEFITRLDDGTEDGKLRSRLCALVFFISKLPREAGSDDGIRATPDTLADLLVEDLKAGSSALRQKIPPLLHGLAADGHLMQVDNEYRLQTRESMAWSQSFNGHYAKYLNDDQFITQERAELLREACGDILGKIKLQQGASKVARRLDLHFTQECPAGEGPGIPIWIRDGWDVSESTLISDARAAGMDSPVVLVFIPKQSNDELKKLIASAKGAKTTLDIQGTPSTPEGQEAQGSMTTRLMSAERDRTLLIGDILTHARVFNGGGNECTGIELRDRVEDAAKAALIRLYSQFDMGDDSRWEQAIRRARQGSGSPLEVLNYSGETHQHPVCAAILADVGPGKKGAEVRKTFQKKPYGWSQDTVDGGLLALVASGRLRASQDGTTLDIKQIDQTKIGVATFQVEGVVLTAKQRIEIRKLFQGVGIQCKSNEELQQAPAFLQAMRLRAAQAGGDPPLPMRPSVAKIDDLSSRAGNELLQSLFDAREELTDKADQWKKSADRAAQRLPRWETLNQLIALAKGLPETGEVQPQVDAIRDQRSLLIDPDPLPPLCKTLCDALRTSLKAAHEDFQTSYCEAVAGLRQETEWQRLNPTQQAQILSECGLNPAPGVALGTEEDLLYSLEAVPLAEWQLRKDALPGKISNARMAAAKLLEPKAQHVKVSSATLKTEDDVRAWIQKTLMELMKKVKDGPIVIS